MGTKSRGKIEECPRQDLKNRQNNIIKIIQIRMYDQYNNMQNYPKQRRPGQNPEHNRTKTIRIKTIKITSIKNYYSSFAAGINCCEDSF